ncbi:MAG TPA: hypothetical protein VJN96_09180 [Vicinamibacterales bacterium]|nr:hypothetical protein [Vicinamibacterales bacterium]
MFAPLVVLVGALGFPAFLIWTWYLMFSALRNVKLIRLELQRLNEILESRLTADSIGVGRR